MARKKQYDKGFEDGRKVGLKEALKNIKAEVAAIESENEKLREARDEIMAELRLVDAALWGAVDNFSADWSKWLTRGEEDINSLRVRSRIATGISIAYDDGYVFHSYRRIGGLTFKPAILHFEHSDPEHVGTIEEAIQYATGEMVYGPAEDYPEEKKDE